MITQDQPETNQKGSGQPTISAALKLLRRRRTGRKPGLSDLDLGTTTAEALFVIQSDACAAFTAAAIDEASCTDVVDWWLPRLVGIKVGKRDGVGDGAFLNRRSAVVEVSLAAVAVPRAVVPFASLGILFGD